MPELDPLTNLPVEQSEDPVVQATKERTNGSSTSKTNGRRKMSATDFLRTSRTTPDFRPQTVPGTFGEYGNINVTTDRPFNEIRAQGQSLLSLAGRALVQSAGTVIGMGIESAGFLGDIPKMATALVEGSEADFERNAVSNFGNWIENKVREQVPIYQTEEAQSGGIGRFADATFWASNAPSIASTLALMIPSYGIARGIGATVGAAGGAITGGGRMANMFRKMTGRIGQQSASTIGAATSSRHMEGLLEAYESYETKHQEALDNGMTEMEARQLASRSAADTYRLGYVNMWQDVVQWGALLRGINFGSRAIKGSLSELGEQSGKTGLAAIAREIKKNPTLDVVQAARKAGFTWRDYLGQAGIEGFEEFNQEFIKRLSSSNADIHMGLTEGSEQSYTEAFFGGLMGEHLQDPEAWNAAVFGFLGGAVFQGAGQLANMQWNKSTEETRAKQLKAQQERLNYMKETLQNINIALHKGDEVTAQREREQLVFNMALNGVSKPNGGFVGSATEGTLAHTIEMFQAVENMNAEQLEALGLTEESKQEAKWVLGELNQIDETLNKYYNNTTGTGGDEYISILSTERDYLNEKAREHISDINSRLDQEYNSEHISGALEGLNSDQQRLVKLRQKLNAQQKTYEALEKAPTDAFGAAPFRVKILGKTRKQSMAKLRQEMQATAQEINNLVPENKSKELLQGLPDIEVEQVDPTHVSLSASDVNDAINIQQEIGKEDGKLDMLSRQLEEYQVELFEGEKALSMLHQPSTRREIVEQLSLTGEQLRNRSYNKILRETLDDGQYIQREDQIYRVRKEGDQIQLLEVDRNLEPIEGAEFQNIEDPSQFMNIRSIDPDRVLSEEQVQLLRERFDTAIKEGDFGTALGIIEGELYKSNYGDRRSDTLTEFMEEIEKYVDNIDSINELLTLQEQVYDKLPETRQEAFGTILIGRLTELAQQYDAEIQSIDQAIKEEYAELKKLQGNIDGIDQQIEEVKADLTTQINDILAELESSGKKKLDGRTKTYKKLVKLEEQADQTIQQLKEEQKSIVNLYQQVENDVRTLEKIKKNLDQKELPTVLLQEELDEMMGEIESIRAQILFRSDTTLSRLITLREQYEEAEDSLIEGISAVENFRAYVRNLVDASSVLGEAADAAYEDLINRGVLTGAETRQGGINDYVFETYIRLFNVHLTSLLRTKEFRGQEEQTRRIINKNRLTEAKWNSLMDEHPPHGYTMETARWAAFNMDVPFNTDLLQDPDVERVLTGKDKIDRYVELKEKTDDYTRLLKSMRKNILRKKASVEPTKKPTTKKKDTTPHGFSEPQRTIYSVFSRLAGNSGDNQNPNPDPSQRRYSRFVNKTNVEGKGYKIRIMKGTEEDFDLSGAEEAGYKPDKILMGVVTDAEGNFVLEDGSTTETFNPETAIYTSLPLASYETKSSKWGKTFEVVDQAGEIVNAPYLNKYHEGRTLKDKLAHYQRHKEQLQKNHEKLIELLFEEIEESDNNFTERDIRGKSLGVPHQMENHHKYEEGAEPNPLEDIFDDPISLDIDINTLGEKQHNGELVTIPKGHAVITDPSTGNLVEGALRRMNESEVKTLIDLLRVYARQSTINKNGRINTNEQQEATAGTILDSEGESLGKRVFQVWQEYLYAFDKNGKSRIRLVGSKTVPGGHVLIEGQKFELFADNPEGEGKINQINPSLVDKLNEWLPQQFHYTVSSLNKEDVEYERIVSTEDGFKSVKYDSYKHFMIEEKIVGTWLEKPPRLTIDGVEGAEEGYQFYNQNLYYDNSLPADQIEEVQQEETEQAGEIDEREIQDLTPIQISKIKELKKKTTESDKSFAQDKKKKLESLKKKKETKSEGRSAIPINDVLKGKKDPKAQRIRSPQLTIAEKELRKLSERLTQQTGTPHIILGEQSSMSFLNTLYAKGEIPFKIENTDQLFHGMFHNGAVYIFSKDNATPETPLHEFAHPIVGQIARDNPMLFESLIRELQSTEEGKRVIEHVEKEYPTFSWEEVVTTALGRAATDEYLRKTDSGFMRVIERFWDAIRSFFKNVFGIQVDPSTLNTDTTISDLATILTSGDPIRINHEHNYNEPSMMITSNYSLPGQSIKFTADAVEAVNHIFFFKLFEENQNRIPELLNNENNEGLYNDLIDSTWNEIYDTTQNLISYIDGIEKGTKDLIPGYTLSDMKEEVNNMVYLLENFDDLIPIHKLHLSKYNIDTIEDTLENETDRSTEELWQRDSIKFSAKQNATSMIRMLIGTLTSNKTNDTFSFIPKNVDFGKTFNALANHLAGTTTLEEKISKLENLRSKGLDGVAELFERVFDKPVEDLTTEEAITLLQFNEVFSKHNNTYTIVKSDKGHIYKPINANINSGQKRIINDWSRNVDLGSPKYKIEQGQVIYDTEYFNREYPDDYSIRRKGEVTPEQQQIIDEAPSKDKVQYENYFKTINFLKELGVEITVNAPLEKEFNDRVQHILNGIKKGDIPNIFAENSNAYQDLRELAQYEAEHSVDNVENQHLNINNETVYNVVLNHYISLLEDKINKSNSREDVLQELPHLMNSAYTNNSLLLNRQGSSSSIATKLFDENGDRKNDFTVEIIEGVSGNEQAKEFDSLTMTDKVQLTINSISAGRVPLFRTGDKRQERFLDIGEFFSTQDINRGEYHDVFVDYLADELEYILELDNLPEYSGVTDLIENPFENSILPQLFSRNKTLKKLMTDILDGSVQVNELRTDDNKRLIRFTLDNYINEKIEQGRELLEENYIIEKEGEIYKNHGLTGLTENEGIEYTQKQVDQILKKAIINRSVTNIEQTKLFSGHPAFYKKTDNFFHRMSASVSTKKISSIGHMENQLIERLFPSDYRLYKYVDENGNIAESSEYKEGHKPILRTAVFADPEVQSRALTFIKEHTDSSPYENIEESDAMGLVSLDTYRDMKIRSGEWNKALERLYQWENGNTEFTWNGEAETITEKDLVNADGSRTTFNPLKPQYFGPMAEDNFIPGMYKLAVIPVLPSYQNEAMNSLRQYMDNNDVGLVTFETANKVGTKEPGKPAYNNEGLPNTENITTQDTWFEYWGIQLNTGNKVKDRVILGSQFMKQIFSDMFENGQAINEELGQSAEEMSNIHNALIEKGKQELIEELGLVVDKDDNYTVESVDSLINFLIKEANKRDANHNVLDGLTYFKDYIESNLGLDVLSNRDKIENILAAIADSRVISQNVHGGSRLQAASTFFEENPRVKVDGKLLSSELNFYEDGTMEVYLPHYFKGLLGDLEVSEVDQRLLNAVSYRIPTSGMNTIERITIKGFLPQSAGDIIVLPSEVVAKEGSDFDADKQYTLLPNYIVERGVPKYIEFIDGDPTDSDVLRKIYDQKYEREIMALKLAKRNLDQIEEWFDLFGDEKVGILTNALGLATDKSYTLGDIVDELNSIGREGIAERISEMPTFAEFKKQSKGKSIYELNSKQALQNKMIETASEIISHPENRSNLLEPLGIDILESQEKRINKLRGQIIPDVGYHDMLLDLKYGMQVVQRSTESIRGRGISMLHVADHIHGQRYGYMMGDEHEIALPHNKKDGKVSLGGVKDASGKNKISNVLNQIANMFIDGVKNPISYELNFNLDNAPVLMYLTRAGVPIDVVVNFMNQPIIKDYVHLKSVQQSFPNQQGQVLSNTKINKILSDKYGRVTMKEDIKANKLIDSLRPEKGRNMSKPEFNKLQRKVLTEYKKYEESAGVLGQYVNATRIDTVAMGKNTAQLDLLLHQLEKIEDGFPVLNTDKVIKEGGYLAPHYKALKDFREMFTPFFIHLKNDQVDRMYQSLIDHIADKKITMDEKVSILDKFKSDLIAYVVLKNEVKIDGELVPPMGVDKTLFKGDNSLPKRIVQLKKEGIDNLLIDQLMPVIGQSQVNGEFIDNLKLYDQRMDTLEQNMMIQAWRELFTTHPETARDLVKFTMVQSGLQLSPITFTKFIPAEIYSEMINSAFTNQGQINEIEFLEKFFENNYTDENLIPTRRGRKLPSGKIYKQYRRKEKNGKPLSDSEISANIRKGINSYEAVPDIYLKDDKGMVVGEHKLFVDTTRVRPQAIKDFKNNRSLLSYGFKSNKSKPIIDHNSGNIMETRDELPEPSQEQMESLARESSTSLKEIQKRKDRCKR